jgi:hypothetical protein
VEDKGLFQVGPTAQGNAKQTVEHSQMKVDEKRINGMLGASGINHMTQDTPGI